MLIPRRPLARLLLVGVVAVASGRSWPLVGAAFAPVTHTRERVGYAAPSPPPRRPNTGRGSSGPAVCRAVSAPLQQTAGHNRARVRTNQEPDYTNYIRNLNTIASCIGNET